ncbi:MAG: hypothetical protein JWO03_907 [Bacteroidetes bacterium]|nr:hypothetical protein [Bacteroidota bacterium]
MEAIGITGIIILVAYFAGLLAFLILRHKDEGHKGWSGVGLILIWPLAVFHGYFIKKEERG